MNMTDPRSDKKNTNTMLSNHYPLCSSYYGNIMSATLNVLSSDMVITSRCLWGENTAQVTVPT